MSPTARTIAATAVFLLGSGASAFAVTPPQADVSSFSALATPLPEPYDPAADSDPHAVDAKIARARAQALAEHKLLLIDMGGNWCPDCRILAGTMALPNLHRFVDAHYVEVTVDAGRHINQNLQVAARFGVSKLDGVPSVFIVDPATGGLVDSGHTAALSDARDMSPQGLADWLAQWPGP